MARLTLDRNMVFPEILFEHEVLQSLMTYEFVYPITEVSLQERYAYFHCEISTNIRISKFYKLCLKPQK
jgi:hypothetical protein